MLGRLTLVAIAMLAVARGASAAEATIGYQLLNAPWAVPIVEETFQTTSHYRIDWVRRDSGSQMAAAMKDGNLQVGVMSSAALARAVSGGADLQLIWILSQPQRSQRLIVRHGSAIEPERPTTLRGARIAVSFGSDAFVDLLAAMASWGIHRDAVKLIDMQPAQIASSWERGDIDAAFVQDPLADRIGRNGIVMVTSAEIAGEGPGGFEGLVARRDFIEANRDFLVQLLRGIAEIDQGYRSEPGAWTAESSMVKAVVAMVGGRPADVPGSLAGSRFPATEEQLSARWLGGEASGGAAATLRSQAERLRSLGLVRTPATDFVRVVTPALAAAAARR